METHAKYEHLVHDGMRPGRVLVSSEQIALRIHQLADEIAIDYDTPVPEILNDNENPLCPECGGHHPLNKPCIVRQAPEFTIVAVMTGAMFMTADLVRALPVMLKIHLLDISSYTGKTTEPGEIHFDSELPQDELANMDVLVIDDVLDSGRTMGELVKRLRLAGANSVRTCVLVSKPLSARANPPKISERICREPDSDKLIENADGPVLLQADYAGFEIPDEFVVGYGMDYDDKYRNLPDICVLQRSR